MSEQPRVERSAGAALRDGRLWGLALLLAALAMLWTTYNRYVPLLLASRFGLPALLITLVLTTDNVLAMLLEPVAGLLSDGTRARLGARLPWLLGALPLLLLPFALLPLPGWGLSPFALLIVGMLVGMALVRTPATALLPDLAAPAHRAVANGLLQAGTGAGTLAALWAGDRLAQLDPLLPFWVSCAAMVTTVALLWALLRRSGHTSAPSVGGIPTPWRRRAPLLSAVTLWWLGFFLWNAGLGDAAEGLLFVWTLAAVPVGLAGKRLGWRPLLATSSVALLLLLLARTLQPTWGGPLAWLAGVPWAAIAVNSLPPVLALGGERWVGGSTGLYYAAFALAGLLAPWLQRALPATPAQLWLPALLWVLVLPLLAASPTTPFPALQGADHDG